MGRASTSKSIEIENHNTEVTAQVAEGMRWIVGLEAATEAVRAVLCRSDADLPDSYRTVLAFHAVTARLIDSDSTARTSTDLMEAFADAISIFTATTQESN